MQYRIEVSQTRKGFGQVHFPGRVIALEASENLGRFWEVAVSDGDDRGGSVAVRADSAGDAVWRVARAVVRAVSELTQGELIQGTADGGASVSESDAALTNVS